MATNTQALRNIQDANKKIKNLPYLKNYTTGQICSLVKNGEFQSYVAKNLLLKPTVTTIITNCANPNNNRSKISSDFVNLITMIKTPRPLAVTTTAQNQAKAAAQAAANAQAAAAAQAAANAKAAAQATANAQAAAQATANAQAAATAQAAKAAANAKAAENAKAAANAKAAENAKAAANSKMALLREKVEKLAANVESVKNALAAPAAGGKHRKTRSKRTSRRSTRRRS